jgi:hypothetical protein
MFSPCSAWWHYWKLLHFDYSSTFLLMLKMEDGFIFVCKMFFKTTMQSMAATAALLLKE